MSEGEGTPGLLRVDEARVRMVSAAGRPRIAAVSLDDAAGLVLAEDVVAGRDLPGFDNSAMDGFAVRVADVAGATSASPVRLRIAGESRAGSGFDGALGAGEAVRIMTGAMLPAGTEAVVEVEATRADGDDVLVMQAVDAGRSLRRAGSDIRRGDLALTAGTHIGAAQVGLMAALGVAHPTCVARPRVAVLATGDELVAVDVEPRPGQVVDVAGPALSAALRGVGAEAIVMPRAADRITDVRASLTRAAAECDLVISVGGVSMGEYDLVRAAVEAEGALDFWKVAMRPGKPLAVGTVGGRLFIGLPGNPVSALVGFEVFVLPVLLALSRRSGWTRPSVDAELAADIHAPGGLRSFVRAMVGSRPGMPPLATPAEGQGSHQLRSLAVSNALLDVDEKTELVTAGMTVRALLTGLPPGPP